MRRAIVLLHGIALVAIVSLIGCGPLPDYGAAPVAEVPDPAPASVIVHVGADERFPIRLAWPATVGQRGRLRFESTNIRTTRLRRGERPDDVHDVDRSSRADGVYQVLAVNDGGTATRVQFDADTFNATTEAGAPLVLDGASIRVDRAEDDAKALVLVNDRAANAEMRAAIDEVIPLEIKDFAPDDDVVGTREPQRIGGRWPIEAEAAREALTEGLLRIPPGAVSGETQLANVVDRGGVQCLEIVGRLDIEPFELTEIPPQAKIQRARIHVVTHFIVPTTPMPRLESEITTTAEITMMVEGTGLIETLSKKQSHWWYQPLPAN